MVGHVPYLPDLNRQGRTVDLKAGAEALWHDQGPVWEAGAVSFAAGEVVTLCSLSLHRWHSLSGESRV